MRLLSLTVVLTMTLAARAEDVEFGPYKSKAPESWKSAAAANNMRVYQATLPKAEGDTEDAELVVFFFGEGGGGGVKANIDRWKTSIKPPEGKKIDDVSKVTEMKVNGDKVTLTYLDIAEGMYLSKKQPFNPNSPTVEKDGFRMLGVVIECDKGPYFVRVTGPKKTVEKHKKAFDEWVKGIK